MREDGLGPGSEEQRRLHTALGFLWTPEALEGPTLFPGVTGYPSYGTGEARGLLPRDTPHSPMVAPSALRSHRSRWGLTTESAGTGVSDSGQLPCCPPAALQNPAGLTTLQGSAGSLSAHGQDWLAVLWTLTPECPEAEQAACPPRTATPSRRSALLTGGSRTPHGRLSAEPGHG